MQCQNNTRVYAGFGVRLAAYLVDIFLVGLITGTIEVISFLCSIISDSNILETKVLFNYTITAIIVYLLKATYFILMTYSSGRTLGKMIFKIKVVSMDGEKPSLWNIIYRETIGRYLSSVIIYVGYIIALADKEKKTLHDMLADTRVIYTIESKKNEPAFKLSTPPGQYMA